MRTAIAALFSGSGGTVDLADGATQSFAYAYTPTGHLQNSASVTLNFANGNSNNTNTAQVVTASLTGQASA